MIRPTITHKGGTEGTNVQRGKLSNFLRGPKAAKSFMLIVVICAAVVVLIASQTSVLSKPTRIGIGPIWTLDERLYWSKAVINGTVSPSTIEVTRGSSFSVLVTLKYLEGRLSDHSPITLLLDSHRSVLIVGVTYNESGVMRQVALNDLVTWDVASISLTPNESVSATMTVNIPYDFPTTMVYFPPLFGYSPSLHVTANVQSIEMTVS